MSRAFHAGAKGPPLNGSNDEPASVDSLASIPPVEAALAADEEGGEYGDDEFEDAEEGGGAPLHHASNWSNSGQTGQASRVQEPATRGVELNEEHFRLKLSTLNPKLQPLNPKPQTLDTKPETPDTQHSTLNTQHSTLNTQHSTLNTQHPTPNTQHPTLNTQHSTLNTQHSTLHPRRAAKYLAEYTGRAFGVLYGAVVPKP